MCYAPDASPPDAPVAKRAAQGEELVLTTDNGVQFAAYYARADKSDGAQVLIYPDVRGLHHFYKQLALRLAEAGVEALAIDYFGRTAGLEPRDESFDHMAHVQQITLPQFFEDVSAALKYLRAGNGKPTFVLGFCMGGALTLLTGTQNFPIAGLIPFYSGFTRVFPGAQGTTLELASQIHYPVLGLYGGADQGIPTSAVEQLDRELDKAGVEHELLIYPGAPHSFFDRKYEEFAEASADAWRRVLTFIAAHRQPAR
jgi:carboxymethylenebutenolidase